MTIRRAGTPLVTLAFAVLLAGCGSESLPPMADAEVARSSLQTALEAWQRGDSAEALRQRTPPIYLNDPRFAAGHRLTRFVIHDGHKEVGQSVQFRATLTLATPDGKTAEKKSGYMVDTAPAVVIVGD